MDVYHLRYIYFLIKVISGYAFKLLSNLDECEFIKRACEGIRFITYGSMNGNKREHKIKRSILKRVCIQQ